MTASFTDIRCLDATPGIFPRATNCVGENTDGWGDDYTGMLLADTQLRITDHYNTDPAFATAGTLTDTPFPVGMPCVSNSSTALGGECNGTTTMDAVMPGFAREQRRASLEIGLPTPDATPRGGMFVLDAGENGVLFDPADGLSCPPTCLGDGDEDRIWEQGVFAP